MGEEREVNQLSLLRHELTRQRASAGRRIADHVYFFLAAALKYHSPGLVIVRVLVSRNLAGPVLIVNCPRLNALEPYLCIQSTCFSGGAQNGGDFLAITQRGNSF
jgi:hypothetical protein